MLGRAYGRAAGGFVALLLVALTTPSVAQGEVDEVPVGAAAAPSGPVRILLVGDSVTQGSAGDWTWRYRLHQHLTAAGVPFDLVGPRNDLYDDVTSTHGSLAYVDPVFDSDHAARWGMWVGLPDVPIGTLVATYDPDVVVEMLGANDVLSGDPPELVVQRVADFVEEARSAKPTVDVVLAEATQHWFAGVPELNAGLDEVAASSTSADSAVVVADTATGYQPGPDTWDNSHPNARGEVRIAAAVADSLHLLGVGPPAARPLALPQVGPRTGAWLSARAGDGSAELQWTGPPGATAQYVWLRDRTLGEPWRRLPVPVTGSSWSTGWLSNGHLYDFRLQPVKGDDEPEGRVFSNVQTLTPRAAAPTSLRAVAGRRCARLSWARVGGASDYRVRLQRATGWALVARTARPRAVVQDLPAARSWRFAVTATRDGVPTLPALVRVRRDRSVTGCG